MKPWKNSNALGLMTEASTVLAAVAAISCANAPYYNVGPSDTGGASAMGGTSAMGGSAGNGGKSALGGSSGNGGAAALGGTSSTGDTSSNGGAPEIGGTSSNGGTATLGGSPSNGGAPEIGGTSSNGGTATLGGSPSIGGASALGGASATGGSSATGGTSNRGGSSATGGTSNRGGSSATGGTTATGGTPATGGSSTTGGTPATGGSSTTGGTPATGGSSTTGGTSNKGGSSATGGTSGPTTTASGVAVFTVPLAASGDGQRFIYRNNTPSGTTYNLSGATLDIVAYAPGATGGDLHVFFASGTSTTNYSSTATDVALSTLATGFRTVKIPVPSAVSGAFDPTLILVTRIEVEAGSGFGTSWKTPATVVYIDSISSSNGVLRDTFDTTIMPDGSTNILANSGARTVTGFSLGWLATYP